MNSGSKMWLRAVKSVAGEPDQLVLGEPQRARVIELVDQLALVDDVGEPAPTSSG